MRRVLAIDDEEVVLRSLERTLEPEGFTVESTRSSREGLRWALERSYDLVLTDIRMPDIGGMHILRDIKRAKPCLPVVMITGYATVRSAVSAMKLGAADYLEKPLAPDSILTAVRAALGAVTPTEVQDQSLVHREEVLRVLDRASQDAAFAAELHEHGVEALEDYALTPAERLAILTGDLQWIEAGVGGLTPAQRAWLESRLAAEVW